MSLSPGTKLGPYEVLAALGAGGMGEVYRARDARIGREVAVKVLPSDVAVDGERLRRFEREARTVGSLSHPNLLALFDVGRHEGVPYLVTELLDGATLRGLLTDGRFPQRKAVEYAIQIARGLAAAHEKGVVHRDVKPENVFVDRDGQVKVLDFGLATVVRPDEADKADSDLITSTSPTHAGVLAGTIGYMSPEQVRGQPADERSDVFALGAVLYEMLSGKRAFKRDSQVETLHAILNEDPPEVSRSDQPLPVPLERIVRRCLEKDPRQRFRSAQDVAFALEAVAGSGVSGPAVAAERTATDRLWSWLGAGLIALAALGAVAYGLGRASGIATGRIAAVPTLRQLTFRKGSIGSARFSPDGNTVLYDADWDGGPHEVYSTRLDSVESRSLGLVGAEVVATAPGEVFVHRRQNDTLARAPLEGGTLREIADHVDWADWARASGTAAILRSVGGRQRLEFPVGRVLYEATPPSSMDKVRVSPHGDLVAFDEFTDNTSGAGSIAVVDLAGRKTVLSSGWSESVGLAWSPDSSEVWFTAARIGRSRALYAVSLTGKVRTLLRTPGSLALLDIFPDGRVLLMHLRMRYQAAGFFPGDKQEHDYSWMDETMATGLSPDGKKLVLHEDGEGGGSSFSSYLRETDGKAAVRLGDGAATAFSDDGRFVLAYDPRHELTLIPTGPGESRRLRRGTIDRIIWATFFPDGKRILIAGHEAGRPVRDFVQDLPDGEPRAVTPEGVRHWAPNPISPDGRIAACAGGLSSWTLYPVDGGAPEPMPWIKGGERLERWSADGRAVYIREAKRPQARIVRLDLRTGRRELWKELFPADGAGVYEIPFPLITPDGRYYAYSYGRDLSELYLVEGLK
jgi:eukaryotic-like serine/threonine-protein kinase